jgi:OFA family oxalate/formate antiporter-like MFS transporter
MAFLHPDQPFAPRRLPFFYGWWIAVVATLGVLMSIPGQTMGVSVFTDDLLKVTGLSRLGLSNTYLVGTIVAGLALPIGGRWIDRVGTRVTAMIASLGLAATLVFLSFVDRVVGALASVLGFVSPESVAAVVLSLAFVSLRFCGQGLLTMSSRAMVGRWFERRRGLVSGMTGVFTNFGFSLTPVFFLAWIGFAGWRGAWLGMALAVGLGMTGIAWLFFRDNPEECGLRMDGQAQPLDSTGAELPSQEHSLTREQAIRTLHFWYVTGVLAIQSMVFTGTTFHIVDLGAQQGLERAASVAIFIPIAVIGTATGFGVGVAADRIALKWLVMGMASFQIVGFVGMAYLGDPTFMVVAIVGWGFSQGFFGPLTTVAIPKLFGRAHLGAIAGVQMSVLVLGSALGPALLAASQRYLGGYAPGLLAACGLSFAVLAVALVSREPAADA